MIENLETNRTRIIRDLKETFKRPKPKEKEQNKKKKTLKETQTIHGIHGTKDLIIIYYPQRAKTLDSNHNKAKCYEKGTTGK